MDCNKKGCTGKLVKLEKYYVCNICCKDMTSFKEISNIVKEKRGALIKKPKGKCMEILHPELSGFYTYVGVRKNEWRKKYTIYGKDKKLMGSIEFEDYRNADFIVNYNGPCCIAHIKQKDYISTLSILPNEINFYE